MTEHVPVEQVRAVLLNSLYLFNKEVLQKSNEHDQLRENPHLELCRTVENWKTKRKKLILMPRGTFKSSCVTIAYSIQQLAKNPNIRILIGSEINSTAKVFLREIKDHFETNENMRYLFGEHVRYKSRWTDDSITSAQRKKNLKEPSIFTTGTDQSRTGWHADLAILDDPVSATNISTRDAREKTLNWYREISNNILEPETGHLIVIGTKWHFNDLYANIIENEEEEFEVITKQAMTDKAYRILVSDRHVAEKERRIDKKELIFPNRLTVRELWSKYRSSGSAMFNNQFMNRVIDDENADFREANIQWYDPYDDQQRIRNLNTYISVDPAISEAQNADFTAIVCVGVNEKNEWFVIEYDNFRGKPQEIMDKIFRMHQRRKPRKVGIEVVAYQKSLMYSLKDEMSNRAVHLPLVELARDNTTTKEMRIRGTLQPIIEQKRLYLQKGMTELIEQLRTFPKCRYDDLLDALADTGQIISGYWARPMKRADMTREELEDLQASKRMVQSNVRSPITKY